MRVTAAHVIGIKDRVVGVYEPRMFRPFVNLPVGHRELTQWEFDRHLHDFPDPSRPDLNSKVWELFLESTQIKRQQS